MIRITDTVKHLIIINVLMFILPMMMWGEYGRTFLALYYPMYEEFAPYQFVTSIFMHGDLMHLLFNMYMLYFLGVMLESYWGPKKFLLYYLVCGVGASVFSLLIDFVMLQYMNVMPGSSWGASGAIFGLLMAAAMVFPNRKVSLILPPVTLSFKILVPLLMALELYLGMSGKNTGIGHFAHLGGAVVGFFLILFWRKSGQGNRWS